MPELPEVETVRRGLAPILEGRRFVHVIARRPDLRQPLPMDFAARLQGQKISRVGRRAKYLLIETESGPVLIIHLGMSGRMVLGDSQDKTPPARHDHIIFETDQNVRITFNDPRRFGLMTFADKERLSEHKLLANIGPEPLGNDFHADYLLAALKRRKTNMKAALLDQKLVAGLGNIYVAEALYRAGINPQRGTGSITARKAERLVHAIRAVLQDAIAAGGSSLKDFAAVDGELGYFQHCFQVYDCAGEPCGKAGCNGIIKRIIQSGRSTYYCPVCQR